MESNTGLVSIRNVGTREPDPIKGTKLAWLPAIAEIDDDQSPQRPFNAFLSSVFNNLHAQMGLPKYLEIRLSRLICG